MDKKEFLAFSLPFGLKCKSKYIGEYYKADWVLLIGLLDLKSCSVSLPKSTTHYPHLSRSIEDIKPILHQLSSLTKEIEHKGERFVPIVELAKINDEWLKSGDVYNIKGYSSDVYHDGKSEMRYECKSFEKTTNMGSLSIVFGYDDRLFRFYKYDETRGLTRAVAYQLQLFQKLIEWHFDICGLIEKGEATDVNTLSVNPYA